VSSRGTGPDGPLRIQVPDPYFSPNGDGVKDSLNFNVIAETSEPYFVAIKRNGIGVKTWPNLVGNQSLSWNGNFMFTDKLQADGKYRIVAMTERQRDRVRDDQMVVLDTVGPEMKKLYAKKSSGNVQITAKVTDKLAGIAESITPLPIRPQLLNSTTTGIGSYFGKDYFYELQNPFFQPVPDGTLSYRLSATDRAGNTNTVDGDNRAPVIRIVEVAANDDLHLIIKAKIEDQEADIDINSIKLDLEPLGIDVKASSQYYDTSKKLLTLEVTDYLVKIDDSGQALSTNNFRIQNEEERLPQLYASNILGINQIQTFTPKDAVYIAGQAHVLCRGNVHCLAMMAGLGIIITVDGLTNMDAVLAKAILKWGGFILPYDEKILKILDSDLLIDINFRLDTKTFLSLSSGERVGLLTESLARIHLRSLLNKERPRFQKFWSFLGNDIFDIKVDNLQFKDPTISNPRAKPIFEVGNLIYKDNGDGTIDIIGTSESKSTSGLDAPIKQINEKEKQLRSLMAIGNGSYLAKNITFKIGPGSQSRSVKIRNIVPENDFLRYVVRGPNSQPITKQWDTWVENNIMVMRIPECSKLFNGLLNSMLTGDFNNAQIQCISDDYPFKNDNKMLDYLNKTGIIKF
jgi:hypothetical protein